MAILKVNTGTSSAPVYEEVSGGSGNVVGPASSTDNAVARYDGVTGKQIQDSNTTISDAGAMTVDDGSGNAIVLTPGSTAPIISMNGSTVITLIPAVRILTITSVAGTGSAINITPQDAAGVATINLLNVTTTQATTVNVGSDAAGGTGSMNVDNITARRTNGALTLAGNGTGEVRLATTDKIEFRDTEIFIHSDADGVLLIEADTKVKVVFPGKEIGRVVSVATPDNTNSDIAQGQTYAGGSTPIVQHRGIAFAAGSDEFMDYECVMYDDYDGSTSIVVRLPLLAVNDATSNTAAFSVEIGRIQYGTTDLDADIFSGSTAVVGTKALAGAQGKPVTLEVTITNSEANSIAGGDDFILRIFRDVSGDGVANDIIVKPGIRVVYA